LEDVERAIRFSTCFWGGIYNPILLLGASHTRDLIRLFRLDTLHPSSADPQLTEFAGSVDYLPWPFFHKELFIQGQSQMLDVHHVAIELAEARLRHLIPEDQLPVMVSWDAADPVANSLLANFGAFPLAADIGVDYPAFLTRRLGAETISINVTRPIPRGLVRATTPLKLTGFDLLGYGRVALRRAGFFVGHSRSTEDLVAFWNLRAAGWPLFFVDREYLSRYSEITDELAELIRSREERVVVWSKELLKDTEYRHFGSPAILRRTLSEHTWNGLAVVPQVYRSGSHSSVGSISTEYGEEVATLPLLAKPFGALSGLDAQELVVTFGDGRLMGHGTRRTFCPPFIPQLNEFYGRALWYDWNKARAEPEGIGIITDLQTTSISLTALNHDTIVERVFGRVGIEATPSEAGRVCNRVIDQMEGIRGCRVFRITGVRNLFRQYNPDQPFPKQAALQAIRDVDPVTRQESLSRFGHLRIISHQSRPLGASNVFDYLISRKVLRSGLRPTCTKCRLRFWLPLDRIRTHVTCELCGERFDLTGQLQTLKWQYQRSGVFGKIQDNRGPIPVALVLHQLQEVLRFQPFVFSTGMDLKRAASPTRCEIDLVVVTFHPRGGTSIVVGECKAAGSVDENDIQTLIAIAGDIEKLGVNTYILLAKTATFSTEEIALARSARERYRERVILLSGRELETEDIVGEGEDLPQRLRHAHTLSDLAHVTTHRYFGGEYPQTDFLDGYEGPTAGPGSSE